MFCMHTARLVVQKLFRRFALIISVKVSVDKICFGHSKLNNSEELSGLLSLPFDSLVSWVLDWG